MVRTTREERERLAGAREVEVVIPLRKAKPGTKSINRMLRDRYHFTIDLDEDSDTLGQLFYNPDLRSQMGFADTYGGIEDSVYLVVWPWYYSGSGEGSSWRYDEGWGETYWKRLLKDATYVKAASIGFEREA